MDLYKSIIKPGLFSYSHTEIVNLANGATQIGVINISNDSDFNCFEIRGLINAPAVLTGGVFIQFSLESGDLFSNVAIDAKSFCTIDGIANNAFSGYPIRLPSDVKIPANSVINVTVLNSSGQAIDIQVQLWGYKVQKES